MAHRPYVRVSKDDQNGIKYELMGRDGEKICDLSFVDVVEMTMQLASSLRWQGVK